MGSEIKQNSAGKTGSLSTLNIGTGRPTSVLDLARIMIDIFGFGGEIKPVNFDSLKGDILHSYADTRRAEEQLEFSAKEELKSGLEKQCRYGSATSSPSDGNEIRWSSHL
jgi:nucleoside-diphosphate-sugar epimerase